MNCKNCGGRIAYWGDDGGWLHWDGYRACPPLIVSFAEPEEA